MNSKQLTLAWIASISALGLFCALAFYVDSRTPPILQETDLADVEVVVIGSSLAHAAIPAFEVGGSLFDDGRRHKMLLVGGITEEESLAIIDHAIDRGVSTLIVEANDRLYERVRRDWRERISWGAARFAERFHRGVRLLEGSQSTEVHFREGEFPEHTGTLKIRRKKFKPPYRIRVREDGSGGLVERLSRARKSGIEIFLFVPPFSNYYDESLTGTVRAIETQADRLADILAIDLWRAESSWENGLFRDVIHLNVHGRDRFVGELKAWLKVKEDKVSNLGLSRDATLIHADAPPGAAAGIRIAASRTVNVATLSNAASLTQQASAR